MNLLIDTGNSAHRWALHTAAGLGPPGYVLHAGNDLTGCLANTLDLADAPQQIVIASVLDSARNKVLGQYLEGRFGCPVHWLWPAREAYGLTCAYERPETLGADRWAAMIGARSLVDGPVCIADCGTAVTVDVVDAEGKHRGGLIAPGIRMMRNSLLRDTAGVAIDATDTRGWLARSTGAAVHTATLGAVAALIDRAVTELPGELRHNLHCLITGGDAETVMEKLVTPFTHEPALILQGLADVTRRNA